MALTDHKPFVKAWVDSYNTNRGVKGVALRTDMDVEAVYRKANYLRKQGVNLPKMARSAAILDVDALNAYIDKTIQR